MYQTEENINRERVTKYNEMKVKFANDKEILEYEGK